MGLCSLSQRQHAADVLASGRGSALSGRLLQAKRAEPPLMLQRARTRLLFQLAHRAYLFFKWEVAKIPRRGSDQSLSPKYCFFNWLFCQALINVNFLS